ncbi:MAG: creatininase family protein [Carbonactinosporaceae bacterium]
MAVRHLVELTREELPARKDDVLVLPLGSTEQHGPHLPLGTDTLLVSAVADAATAHAGERLDVVLGPSLPYGISPHHVFAGAASLQPATYQRVIRDLLGSLAESGFARFFLLNGHGGNHDSLGVVAKSAPLEHGVSVGVCSYWNTIAGRLTDLDIDADDLPGHAGAFETSLVLAVRPELVSMERAPARRPEPPPVWARPPHAGLEVQLPGEWPRVGGYSDPSNGARPDLGRAVIDRIVPEVSRAIATFAEAARAQGSGGAR